MERKKKIKKEHECTVEIRDLFRGFLFTPMAAISMLQYSMVAISAPKIEEVIVTAQKREENIQTVPLAITAITDIELENKGITNFEGVARSTPSISFTPFPTSSTTLILTMRGQGFSDPGQLTMDGAVGLYVDGFFISRPQASTFDLADIERVEVLRGPQGTLYGRNTTGGAVNLISKQPTGEFGFNQYLSAGTRDYFRSLTTINFPEWNDVSTKLTLLKSSIEGHVKNLGSSHDYGEQAQEGGRFSLRWDPTSQLSTDYFYETGELNSTPIYYQNPALNGLPLFNASTPYFAKDQPMRRTYRPVDLNLSVARFEGHGLTLTWDISDSFSIKSLTGYRKLTNHDYQDFVEANGIVFNSDTLLKHRQFSQEFQFIGSLLGDHIDYVVGLYYLDEDGHNQAINNLPAFRLVNTNSVKAESKSKAVFGQLTWTPPVLEDRLQLTLGGRYTKDDKSAERSMRNNMVGQIENGKATGSFNDHEFSRFNPSFTANFQWTYDLSVYARFATAYKAGGSLQSAAVGTFNQTFDPEEVKNYEIGLKSYWFDRRLRANAAVFDSRLEDYQLVIAIDPSNPSSNQAYNAGKSTIRGYELELLFLPIEDLSIKLDYTHYMNAEFTEVDVIPGTIVDGSVNRASPYRVGDNVKDLFTVPLTPKNSVDLNLDYTFYHFANGTLSTNLNYRWRRKQFEAPPAGPAVPGRELAEIPTYGVFDARLTMSLDLPRGDRARVSLWGKNVFNKKYPQHNSGTGGNVVPIISPRTGAFTPAGVQTAAPAWNEPPAYGIDLVYEY